MALVGAYEVDVWVVEATEVDLEDLKRKVQHEICYPRNGPPPSLCLVLGPYRDHGGDSIMGSIFLSCLAPHIHEQVKVCI